MMSWAVPGDVVVKLANTSLKLSAADPHVSAISTLAVAAAAPAASTVPACINAARTQALSDITGHPAATAWARNLSSGSTATGSLTSVISGRSL